MGQDRISKARRNLVASQSIAINATWGTTDDGQPEVFIQNDECDSVSDLVMSCDKAEVARVCHVFNHKSKACAESISVYELPLKGGYFFRSKLAVDVDGAPRAYHPKDLRPSSGNNTKALDWLDNVSSNDLHGIQGKDGVGPESGFFVSATTLSNPDFPENDTRHWVDAEQIPYVVLISSFPRLQNPALNVRKGDCAMVIDLRTGANSPAIFADVGSAVGEGSLKLAFNLGLDPTKSRTPPKVIGFDRIDFLHIVFPNTQIAAPWLLKDINAKTETAFQEWGGWLQARECFPTLPARLTPSVGPS